MTITLNGQLDPTYYNQNQLAGARVADRNPPMRKFYGIEDHCSTLRWIASGVVAKAGTIMQKDSMNFLVPHRGYKEKAIVTFLATLTSGKVATIAGLTFTAGSSGCTVSNLVKAWKDIPVGTSAADATTLAAANGITSAIGTFTSGTLTNYLSEAVTVNDIAPNSVAFVYTGTDADPSNLTVTSDNVATLTSVDIIIASQDFQKIEGVLCFDVNTIAGATQYAVYEEGCFYADDDGRSFLRWRKETGDTVYDPVNDVNVACTAYNTGCYGNTNAAQRAKQAFVSGSEFDIFLFQAGANISLQSETDYLVGAVA